MAVHHREWNPDCKVYIGNLTEGTSKNDVEHSFGKYGALKNVWVARNPPGFAFVEFEDARDAEDAVRGLDGTKISGSRIRVEMSHGRSRRGGYHSAGGDRRNGPPSHRYGDAPRGRYNDRSYGNDRYGGDRRRGERYGGPRGRSPAPRSRSRSPPPKRPVMSRYSRSPNGREPGRRVSRSISRSPVANGRSGGRPVHHSPSPSPPPHRDRMPRTPPSRSRSISPARR